MLIEYSTHDVRPPLRPHETARLPTGRFFFFFLEFHLIYFTYFT